MARFKTEKRIKSPKNIIILTLISTIIVCVFSLSKYESSVAGTSTKAVALMANSVKTTLTDVTGKPGDTFIYKIIIKNYEEDDEEDDEEKNICDVSETFNLSLVTTTNIPTSIKLYKDEKCTEELIANDDGYYEDDNFFFTAGVESETTVYIEIKWDSTDNDSSYSQELDRITLYTNITQLD